MAKKNSSEISESAKKRYSHGYMQSQIVGLQGDTEDRGDTPDIHVLTGKIADPEPGAGADAQREHIRRMRANGQLT